MPRRSWASGLMMMRQTATRDLLGQQAMTAAVTQLAAATAGKTIATWSAEAGPGRRLGDHRQRRGDDHSGLGYAWLRLCEGHYDGKIRTCFEYLEWMT